MARPKKSEADASFDPSTFDQQSENATPETGQSSPDAETSSSHTASVGRKQYTRPVDPFGFENIKTPQNRVRLLKSEGERAFVIRFDRNPNLETGPNGETYSKEKPHPVLAMLKSQGYRWGFDANDGLGGWGKTFEGDPYGLQHIEARTVLAKAAEMLGGPVHSEGRSV